MGEVVKVMGAYPPMAYSRTSLKVLLVTCAGKKKVLVKVNPEGKYGEWS